MCLKNTGELFYTLLGIVKYLLMIKLHNLKISILIRESCLSKTNEIEAAIFFTVIMMLKL